MKSFLFAAVADSGENCEFDIFSRDGYIGFYSF